MHIFNVLVSFHLCIFSMYYTHLVDKKPLKICVYKQIFLDRRDDILYTV